MGYRSTQEAASARIQALEHEVRALRAAAEPPADPSRLTTPRERELTHALAEARSEVETLRRAKARPPTDPRTVLGMMGVFGMLALTAGLVLLLSLVGHATPRHAAARARERPVAAASAPAPAPPAPAEDPICELEAR